MPVQVSHKFAKLRLRQRQQTAGSSRRIQFDIEEPTERSSEENSLAQWKSPPQKLMWFMGLMGETKPLLSPLAVDPESKLFLYRYDWSFGVGCSSSDISSWWDWQGELRKKDSALSVQLIVCSDGSVGLTDISAALVALTPSRNTPSFFESKGPAFARQLLGLSANVAQPFLPWVAQGLQVASSMPEAIASHAKEQTYWFMYRFVDAATSGYGIEWRISKSVLHEFGPLLRGSVVLAFHGGGDPARVRIQLRPQMNFDDNDELGFSAIEDERTPYLILEPRTPPGIAE